MEEGRRNDLDDISEIVDKGDNNGETRLEYHDEQPASSQENVLQNMSRVYSSGPFLSILSCCIVCVGAFSQGALFMWNSAALPQMRNRSSYVDQIPPLTDIQASWVGLTSRQ